MPSLYQQRKAAGLCPGCGGERDDGCVQCSACRDAYQARKRKREGKPHPQHVPGFKRNGLSPTKCRHRSYRDGGKPVFCRAPAASLPEQLCAEHLAKLRRPLSLPRGYRAFAGVDRDEMLEELSTLGRVSPPL